MVDKDRVKGQTKVIKGDLKETAADITGSPRLKEEGRRDKTEGRIDKVKGDIKDTIRDLTR
jgi:uncharacterized protein YjbJ (UPF0337 family)